MINPEKKQQAGEALVGFIELFDGSEPMTVDPEYVRGAAELFHYLFGEGDTEETVRGLAAMVGQEPYDRSKLEQEEYPDFAMVQMQTVVFKKVKEFLTSKHINMLQVPSQDGMDTFVTVPEIHAYEG